MLTGVLRVLLTTALVVAPAVALAGEPPGDLDPATRLKRSPAAREHFAKGTRLYRVREFAQAIVEFKAGALLEADPSWDYNLGQCYRQLGQYRDAIWHYERFLQSGNPSPEMRGALAGLIEQMNAELARKAMSQPPTGLVATTEVKQEAPAMVVAASPADTSWYSDSVGWSLVAGGVLSGAGAGLLLWSASSLASEADGTPSEGERKELREAAHVRGVLGTTIAVGAGVLAISGVLKLAIHGHAHTPARTATWGVGVSHNRLTILGRF